MYEEEFEVLGLTNNEIKIYLFLLKNGLANPSEISQKLGLHRGYVYDALERMNEKGIVNTLLQNNKKQFQANNPHNLLESINMRTREFQKIMPELSEMIATDKTDTRVELHKGRRVYRTLIKDVIATLKRNDEVLIIGIDESKQEEIEPIYLAQYFKIIKTRRITERIIIKKGTKRIKNPSLQFREIDEEFIGNIAQIIYGSKVAIFILGIPYHLIVIENKEVAEAYRKQFELMWKVAKR